MADLATIHRPPEPARPAGPVPTRREWRLPAGERLALGGITLLSLILGFYRLGGNGFPNPYYAAGVRSMLDSWHNFFFVSYDPGGFVTIDKPPLGFWLQAASAQVLGFSPFSVLLPQVIAGALAVLLLYVLVRRSFGVGSGLLAALVLAVSPISVITSRNNTIDSTLALVLLAGAWAVLRAAETGRLRWLLLSAVLVGIGFNVKMAEAYLVVPAFALLYLLAAPIRWPVRIGHLAVAGALMLAISLAWVTAVDLVPASARPWVGSTQNNSELSLAVGYNGVDRVLGLFRRGDRGVPSLAGLEQLIGLGSSAAPAANRPPTPPFVLRSGAGAPAAANPPGFPVGGRGANAASRGAFAEGGMFGTGQAGPLRLFQSALGGQIGWLLPLALLGILAVVWQRRPPFLCDPQGRAVLLWGGWLLTMGAFFSVAGFFHQYYLTEMAPAVAALAGIGVVTMWRAYRQADWRGWLLPVALVLTGLEEIYLLSGYPGWDRWLIPLVALLTLGGTLALVVARLSGPLTRSRHWRQGGALAVSLALFGLLVPPGVWAAIPVVQNQASQMPMAGPAPVRDFGGFGAGRGGTDSASTNASLIAYLGAHQGNATYLLATPSSMTADSLILATNRPVMAMGGFMGGDPILTPAKLAQLVAHGTVRFFLLSESRFGGGYGPSGGSQAALTTWISQSCRVVPSSAYQPTGSNLGLGGPFGGASQLYDCGSAG